MSEPNLSLNNLDDETDISEPENIEEKAELNLNPLICTNENCRCAKIEVIGQVVIQGIDKRKLLIRCMSCGLCMFFQYDENNEPLSLSKVNASPNYIR